MSACPPGSKFTFVDLLTVVVVVGIFVMMISCGTSQVEMAARRNQCQNNLRKISQALFAVGRSRAGFPHASTASVRHSNRYVGLPLVGGISVDGQQFPAPGVADPTHGGYSWQVQILAQLDEIKLCNDIAVASRKFKSPAFDPSVKPNGGGSNPPPHFCQRTVPVLKCPAYPGGFFADEQQELYQGQYANPGISNYVCIPGTHFKRDGALEENGVIVSRAGTDEMGTRRLRQEDIRDGCSKTIIVTETREPNYASWYDGQVNWVTALSPKHQADFKADGLPADNNGDGIPDVISADNWKTALNVGPDSDADTRNVYLKQFPYTKDKTYGGRRWGPSSMHGGGVVLHVFADGHTAVMAKDTDATVYFGLVTRSGNDKADVDALTGD